MASQRYKCYYCGKTTSSPSYSRCLRSPSGEHDFRPV